MTDTASEAGFPAVIPSPATLAELHAVMLRCTRCELFRTRTQVVPGEGDPDARVLFVGEAPGASEDRTGRPFVGASGQLLEAMLALAGLRRAEVFIANVIRSRPPANRAPRAPELRACAGWLVEQIRLVRPEVVVPLGRSALQHFLPAGKISQLQGVPQTMEYQGRALTLYPLLHPSAVLRNPELRPAYAEQFRRLAAL